MRFKTDSNHRNGAIFRLSSVVWRLAAIAIGVVAAGGGGFARAATITVNSANDPGGFNAAITIGTLGGTVTLRDAVNAANNTAGDDTIVFAASLAGQTIGLAQVGDTNASNSALAVTSGITILAPTGGVTITRASGSMRHFYVAPGGRLALDAPELNGLTLSQGLLTGDGGSIYNLGVLGTTNVFFSQSRANSASLGALGRGGAICNTGNGTYAASLTKFQGNLSENFGGALYNNNTNAGAVVMDDGHFGNNFSRGFPVGVNNYLTGGGGGAIYNNGAMSISRIYFGGNGSNQEGGGIYNGDSGNLTVTACYLEDNSLAGDYKIRGGGIRNSGTLLVTGSSFRNNSCPDRGGAIGAYGPLSHIRLINCSFTENSASYGPVIANSGAYGLPGVSAGAVQMDYCTAVGNINGPGTAIHWENGGSFNIRNSILWNTATLGEFSGSIPSYSNSRIRNWSGTNPNVGAIDYLNGGPALTFLSGWSPFVFPLSGGSSALNAAATIADVGADQRGVARPQAGLPDIGAFELAPTSSLVVTTTSDEDNGTSDPGFGSGTSLREALAYANGQSGTQTITFASGLAGQAVTLNTGWSATNDTAALRVSGIVAIRGLTNSPGVTLAMQGGVQKRHLLVESSGSLTLSDLMLTNGYASDYGGSVWSFGSLAVRGCTFAGNHAGSEGGAIQSWGDSPSILVENSTFSGNSSAGIASAIDAGATSMTFRHLTITGNAATNSFGALSIWKNQATLINSIVAGNSDDSLGLVNGGTFSAQSSNNLLGPGNSGGLSDGVDGNIVGVASSNLFLGALANNGGPTTTIAPQSGSPAINVGVVIAGVANDQRGLARSIGTAPDAGAVEDSTGNDDPDGDTLTNAKEVSIGSNPLSIDADNDGFNDATEMLAGTNPGSGGSVPTATRVERVLGYGAARGLDLIGNFLYGCNIGLPGAVGGVDDVYFGADNASGITVSAPNAINDWWAGDFGGQPGDNLLEAVYSSIRWANRDNADPAMRTLQVTLANLTPGRKYKLQLMFVDAPTYNRVFDILVEGSTVFAGFNTYTAQGYHPTTESASALVHEFTAADATLDIELSGLSTAVGDPNPILSGLTLEEIPTPAPAPVISPAGGAYEGSVTVTISNAAPGATVRYTTDGTAPSDSVGEVYGGPFTLWANATVRAAATGGGWAPSESSASYTVNPVLVGFRSLHGLPSDGSQDDANPSGDGVPNLLKFAFNLASNAGDLLLPNGTVLPPNGAAGLPSLTSEGGSGVALRFIRRKASTNPGIGYRVETSEDLLSWTPVDLGAATVESIDGTWERVIVTDALGDPRRFFRVSVFRLDRYFNDFNAGLGDATLRGTAALSSQAVMITDAVGSQVGAVVLDGAAVIPEITGFTSRFKMSIGPEGQPVPADGISFTVGDLGAGPWGESGPGTARNLTVGFDTYDNGGDGSIGIHVWTDGTHRASSAVNPFTDGETVAVEISYDPATGVTVKFNGATIFGGLALPGFELPPDSRFGIGGRTGGAVEQAVIDDIEIFPR